MNCVSFVDLLTVTRTISASIAENNDYYTAAFRSVLPYSGGLNGLAKFMYGSYTGIAMSLFMLVPSFAGMTEKTSAPAIAAAWEKKDCNVLSRTIFTQFRAAAMIGCPACFGAAALAEPIMTMLYSSRAAEVSVCVKPFIILCLGGVFMITASSMFTVFQSVCKAHIPLILMICSVGIKLILNPVLISVPELNISGAALSSSIGYAAMTVGGAIAMKKCIPVKICIFGAVFKPALCGALCGLGAFVLYRAVSVSMSNIFAVLISVGFGAIIYIILLIFTCKFRASGIIKRNFSKKFQKPLEKIEKIG
jgi:stage V sporulation protein B